MPKTRVEDAGHELPVDTKFT